VSHPSAAHLPETDLVLRRLPRLLLLLVVGTLGLPTLLVACSSSGSKSTVQHETTSAPSSEAPVTTVAAPSGIEGSAITISGFAFQPGELRAKVGDTITVTNVDGTDHTLTAVDGSFTTGRFSTGSKSVRVTTAGRFEFKCEVHSFMPHGSIQVSG
jgi:plastocyanin